MSKEMLIGKLLAATPEELRKIEAVFSGAAALAEPLDTRLLTLQAAGEKLGVSRTTIWRLLRDGRLPCVEVRAGSRRIASAAVTAFAAGVPNE